MGLAQRRLNRPSAAPRLQLIIGEGDPARFEKAEQLIPSLGYKFFRVGRLSVDSEIQLGVIRQALREVSFKPEEIDTYEPWLQLTAHQAAMRGVARITPSPSRLQLLRENDDPLMHIIESFEMVRTTEYPDIEHDEKSRSKALGAYALAQASIHGRLRTR